MNNLLRRIALRKLVSEKTMVYKLAVDEEEIAAWRAGTQLPDEKATARLKKEFGVDPNDQRDVAPIAARERIANGLIVASFVVFCIAYFFCFCASAWPLSVPLWIVSFLAVHAFFAYFLSIGIMYRKYVLCGLCFVAALISLIHIVVTSIYLFAFLDHFVF
ncbi:MAG: hypothetical protein MJZ76_10585 [Bacteroidales bacterium]|nr:hypothetical protein [Bacteroidales bacterium]